MGMPKPPPKSAAASRGGRPKRSAEPTIPLFTLKGRRDFGAWVDALAEHAHLPKSTLVEHALLRMAKETGFPEPPPQRT
jgi:hypothetical protein